MADPIQTLQYQMSPLPGIIRRYQTDVNKRTGASITYDITNIGQKTPILQSDPAVVGGNPTYIQTIVDSYTSTYLNLSETDKNFLLNQLGPQANNQRAAFVNKNYTATQRQQLFAGMPKANNVSSQGSSDPLQGAPKPTDPADGGAPIRTSIAGTEQKEGSYKNWVYPTGLSQNKQDFIEFQMIEYGGLKGNAIRTTSFGLEDRQFGTNPNGTLKILGRVFLPIQPTISDINTVDWQNGDINPLQLLGAQTSLGTITGTMKEADFSALKTQFAGNDAVLKYLQQWAAGKAVGLNIFSRFSGAVVNPNLELLFNGPQLRPFNFNFRLSPRSDEEAKQVKGIIRFFKQGMAVRKSSAGAEGLFLKAPNVFKIIYRNGNAGNKEHTSINSIKICSLTQCGVDYTPDGSYATFADPEATMTQYGLTLQFNELEPIFNEDYGEPGSKPSVIGY
jgi:hypothetical protein